MFNLDRGHNRKRSFITKLWLPRHRRDRPSHALIAEALKLVGARELIVTGFAGRPVCSSLFQRAGRF